MNGGAARIRVWDWTIRLFHWLLAAAIPVMWWTAENGHMEWHRRAGFLVLGLLVFRTYWGFAGPETARFSRFVKGPGAVLAYLKKLKERPYRPSFGHNPVGAISVVLLLTVIFVQLLLGLFATDTDGLFSGPLARFISYDLSRNAGELHDTLFKGIVVLAGLHIAAVFFYLFVLKTNLARPMVTGSREKTPLEQESGAGDQTAPMLRAGAGLVLAGAIVGLMVWL